MVVVVVGAVVVAVAGVVVPGGGERSFLEYINGSSYDGWYWDRFATLVQDRTLEFSPI